MLTPAAEEDDEFDELLCNCKRRTVSVSKVATLSTLSVTVSMTHAVGACPDQVTAVAVSASHTPARKDAESSTAARTQPLIPAREKHAVKLPLILLVRRHRGGGGRRARRLVRRTRRRCCRHRRHQYSDRWRRSRSCSLCRTGRASCLDLFVFQRIAFLPRRRR